jgi:hypothetical protein
LTLIGSDDNAVSCGRIVRHIVVAGWDLRKIMALDRQTRAVALGVLALSAVALCCSLAGCSSPIADLPSLGTSDASARPKEPYLPVHDLPPQRDEAVIPPDQRAKIESDLIAARDRQASASAAQGSAAQTTTTQATTTQSTTTQSTAAQTAAAK